MGQQQGRLPKDEKETSDDAAENLVESDSDDKIEGVDDVDGDHGHVIQVVSMCGGDGNEDISEKILVTEADKINGVQQTESSEPTQDPKAVAAECGSSTEMKKTKRPSRMKHRQLKTFAEDTSTSVLLEKPVVASTLQEALDKAACTVKEQNFFSEDLPAETTDINRCSEKEETPEEIPRAKAKRSQSRMRRFFKRKSVMKVMPEEKLEGYASVLDLRAYNNPVTPSGIFDIAVIPPPPEFEDMGDDLTMTENRELYQWLMGEELTPVPMSEYPLPKPEAEHVSPTQLYNSMNDGQKSCYLFDPSFLLIIDARLKHDYAVNHINTAHHLSEIQDNQSAFEPVDEYTLVVVYDQLGMSYSLTDSDLSVAMDKLIAKKADAFVLEGGFRAFQSKYPYLCTTKIPENESERQALVPNYPSIIIEDQLFLGRVDQACQESTIKNLLITHIVCITQETAMPFQNFIRYHHIQLADEPNTCLHSGFPDAIKFMVDAIEGGGRVLVHCNLGQSRSATLVIAYLMYTRKWTLDDAYHFVKEQRPVIHPNEGFMSQLSNFEKALFGKRMTKIESYGYALVPLKEKVVVEAATVEQKELKVAKKQKYKMKKAKNKENESEEQHTMMDYEKLGNESDNEECNDHVENEHDGEVQGGVELNTSLQLDAMPKHEHNGSSSESPLPDVSNLLECDAISEGGSGRRSPGSRGSSPRYTRMSEETGSQAKKTKIGGLRKILVGASSGEREARPRLNEERSGGDDISLIGDLSEEIEDCSHNGISNDAHGSANPGQSREQGNPGVNTATFSHGLNILESSHL